jgi:hypothetical protein
MGVVGAEFDCEMEFVDDTNCKEGFAAGMGWGVE